VIECGRPDPLGAHWDGEGVNFALYSGCAERVELCLFDEAGRKIQSHFLPESRRNTWHGYVPGLAPGQRYGYRVHGPWNPRRGFRCNPRKLLIDPYARALDGEFNWNPSVYDYLPGSSPDKPLISHLDSAASVPKCVVTGPVRAPHAKPSISWRDKIIYEANVRGYTMRHPAVPERERGRLRGLSNGQVLDYLKSLGVTSVELQPVHSMIDESFLARRGLRNLWGYNSINFFSVDNRFAEADALAEFCEMVDAMHDAGLEVFLDVVYNHTAEGGKGGPTVSFRGIDNVAYYRTLPDEPAQHDNVTGCGNAMNADHPVYQDLVLDSLAYWHQEVGLDGFRFDLATTLGRGATGFDREHLLLRRIVLDERLADAHMIAEPWDVGPGGYQLGQFPHKWSEWNDRFRDDTRRFWRGDEGQAGAFAERLHGSADIFDQPGRSPRASVNFVSSHDGFTLADVVSYEHRHNEANGEGNRDGHAHNCSSNYGVEGLSYDPEINRVRRRQRLNMLASVLVAQGMPMLLAGDEFGNSQGGNNNAYCQDNEVGWLDWSGLATDPRFTEQVRELIRLRQKTPLLRHPEFIHGDSGPTIEWMHVDGTPMEADEWARSAGFSLLLSDDDTGDAVVVLVNASRSSRWFGLPEAPRGAEWRLAFHTSEPDPVVLEGRSCGVPELTLAVLLTAVIAAEQKGG
jgi:glycogen operon protein